jgi:hypothetical protein
MEGYKKKGSRFLGTSALGEGLRPSPQLDLENLFFNIFFSEETKKFNQ